MVLETQSMDWNEVLNTPCYVLNMDKCQDRMQLALKRIGEAGFQNVKRFRGVDAECDDLDAAWAVHGSPRFDTSDREFCVEYKGKQGCALGHYGIWKDIIDNNVPCAIIFEDDVEFHSRWKELAKSYWEHTPRDFDILYLGSQVDMPMEGNIIVTPVFCTHAYMITLQGAKKLYDLCLRCPEGTSTIDCKIINTMKRAFATGGREMPFKWYVWNATMFPDPNACKRSDWIKRNSGLVFQDSDLGTFVRPW